MKTVIYILMIVIVFSTISCGTTPKASRDRDPLYQTLWKLTPEYYILKRQFKKEIEFVNKILDNPDKMQEIIETSDYYDRELTDISGMVLNIPKEEAYQHYIDFFKAGENSENKRKPYVANFGWGGTSTHKSGKSFEDCKVVIVSYGKNSYYIVDFIFKEINDKIILLETGFGS